jgi:CheY-like chemotaxis protein
VTIRLRRATRRETLSEKTRYALIEQVVLLESCSAKKPVIPSVSTLETAAARETLARPRILFVDDEPLLTRLGAEFLRRLGYDAVTATCPEDALAKFEAGSFDAVITDLTMPKMSGIELGQALRRSHPGLPVVLTTAFHQKLEGKNPVELGFKSLLLKPYNIQALGDALRAALSAPES